MAEANGSDDAFLTDVWYLASLSRDVKAGAIQHKTILGEPILLGRDSSGAAFALRDICPHRAAPLSAGRLLEEGAYPEDKAATVECPYHGWRFRTSDGVCAAIPSLTNDQEFEVDRIRVRRFPLEEKNGLLWIYIAADKRPGVEPAMPAPDLPDGVSGDPKIVETQLFDCHADQAILQLIDPAHGPFVHRQWWWRTAKSMHEKQKAYAPNEMGFTMVTHPASSNSFAYKIIGGGRPDIEIAFKLPGLRLELMKNNKHTILGLTAITPLTEDKTEIRQIFFWKHALLSAFRPIMQPIMSMFLKQDGRIVGLQHEALPLAGAPILVEQADALVKWYYKCKREWVASRNENRPFNNPVEPTTLRWRT